MADIEEDTKGDISGTVYRTMNHVMREEGNEMLDAITFDRHRLQVVQRRVMALAIRSSPVQQFGMGFGIGWVSGYLFRKVSRTAAFVLGCGFLALQGAVSLGIVSINTEGVKELARHNMRRFETHVRSISGEEAASQGGVFQKLYDFAQTHMFISSGFISGAVVAFTF
ncbi:PREDICTED: FUN14 domain-containing protein 1-like [Amphimedon queenslandica]|uniref:FUN14 domain-containing protein n=1 Tax=Amphimedon queenslandica TaxID=400682 RepID=A0A1X7VS44_AMPQE|nr:PREDICTED: FUN14 domain-containing protein 1-like [Amphimedon queenslandica]|eukprot:XP_003383156.1 PREDICTED: FUN14 domain-containing protein 1-like [Amphimedon queenslandica]